MKTLISLILGAGLVFSGCESNKENNNKSEGVEYSIQDTLLNPVSTNGSLGRFNGVLLTYVVNKTKNNYSLTVKGNIDDKYAKIHFWDMNNDGSILDDNGTIFYKHGKKEGVSICFNGSTAVGLLEDNKTEFYNASDSSRLSQEIIKEAINQMENYFNPLYKKLRARAEEKYEKGIGIIPNSPMEVNQDSIIDKKIKELF